MQVVLYTRGGCHLCEIAWQHLQKARRRYPFELSVVDVDADPQLVASYGEQVPVVTINSRVRFYGAVNEVLLARALRAATDDRV